MANRIQQALHVGVVLTSLSICYSVYDNTLFSWHPVCMSIGYILLMAEGLLGAISFRHLDGQERVLAIQSHMMMQLRSLLFVIIGFVVIFRNKMVHSKPHFHSLHSKVGLLTLCLTMAAPMGGFISFRKLGFIQRFPDHIQPKLKAMHRRVGFITWLLAIVTILLTLRHKAVYKSLLTEVWQVSLVLLSLMMIAATFQKSPKSKVENANTVLKGV